MRPSYQILKHISLKPCLFLSLVIILLLITINSASVRAGTIQWTIVDTPSSQENVIVSPSEINVLAVGIDGRTFYASDIPNAKIYKSTDAGLTWSDLSGYLINGGATLPAWNIALAPDNPNFVAAITSNGGQPGKVFASTDGGASWQDTASPNVNNIGALDISPGYSGNDIAIGTRTGAGNGKIYILKSAITGNWAEQGLSGDVLALKFSPSYRADFSLIAITTDAMGTYANLGIHDIAGNTTNWSTWGPVEVAAAGAGTSPKVNQIISADLELPSNFSGQNSNLRRLYISLDAPAANAGVFRLDDTICRPLMQTTLPLRISSIAYYGSYDSGKLLAGEVQGGINSAAVMTWFTSSPVECAGTCWLQAQKPPTGGGNSGFANTRVVWSPDGSRAYCGTSSATLNTVADWPGGYLVGAPLDESALSVSLDNGETWNQLSLIDSEIDFLSDVAVTGASDVIYLASVNNHGGLNSFDSVWRTTGLATGQTWERVLCLLSVSDDLLLRTNIFGNDSSVYLASRGTNDLKQSPNQGQTWSNTLPGIDITDFAVTSINNSANIFVLSDNYVRRGTTNEQAWQWSPKVDTGLSSGHSINATPTGIITVGDDSEGMVAYSLDEGSSFTRTAAIPEPGKMQVVADYRFRNALPFYAASNSPNSQIYYWIVNNSVNWTSMGSPGRSYYGLAQLYTFYAAWSDAGGTAVDRTLAPENLEPPYIEWDTLHVGLTPGVVFTREPSSLKVSAGINLWAIDNRPYTATTGLLWNFYDSLSPSPQYTPPAPPSHEELFQAPKPISPADEAVIPVYLDTGKIGDVVFEWRHPVPAQEYELWLAKDIGFNQIVLKQNIPIEGNQMPAWTLSGASVLQPDQQYFWQIRVIKAWTGETGDGVWSKVMSFTTASLPQEQGPSPGNTPTPSNNGAESQPVSSNIVLWMGITITILVIAIPLAIFLRPRR